MKNVFFFLIFFPLTSLCQSIDPYVIYRDECEVQPNFQSWTFRSKQVGWETWTYGLQDLQTQSTWANYGHLYKVTQGQYGAPAARKGTGMYRMFLRKRLDYPNATGGENWVRNEMYWGAGCGENVNATDFFLSIYVPSTFCFDTRPVGVAFDFKFCDAQGPASFYLKIENGKWQATRQWPQGTTEYRDFFPSFPEFVNVEKGKWYDLLVKRNFKEDGTGYMQLYMHKQGGTDGFTKVWEYNGPNYHGTNESYVVQGIYKWSWKNPEAQGEGPGNACGNDSIMLFYDRFIFARNAPIATWNAEISGSGTPTHVPPTTDAGVDQTITLPDTDAVMAATTTAGSSAIFERTWTQVSGPNTASISNIHAEDPTMSGLVAGTYVFRLTTADVDEYSTSDEVVIVVQSAPSGSFPQFTDAFGTPMALRDTSIGIEMDSVRFSFFATVANPGFVSPMLMEQIGTTPSVVGIDYSYAEQNGFPVTHLYITGTNFNTAGDYYLKVSAQNSNTGPITYDTIKVTVVPLAADPPTVSAGSDIYLAVDGFGAFPLRSTMLNGVSAAGDAAIKTKRWVVRTGPENSVLGSPTTDTTSFANLISGSYLLRYTVTDDNNNSAFDEIWVHILSVEAGLNQVLTSGSTTTANLQAFIPLAADTTDVTWEILSGPGGGTITNTHSLETTITGLNTGTYEIQITVTWNAGGNVIIARDRLTLIKSEQGVNIFYKYKR